MEKLETLLANLTISTTLGLDITFHQPPLILGGHILANKISNYYWCTKKYRYHLYQTQKHVYINKLHDTSWYSLYSYVLIFPAWKFHHISTNLKGLFPRGNASPWKVGPPDPSRTPQVTVIGVSQKTCICRVAAIRSTTGLQEGTKQRGSRNKTR